MNLFICQTPLHCLIVEQIIKQEKFCVENCEIFYISYNNKNQDIHRAYFKSISVYGVKSKFIEVNGKVFFYFKKFKKLFSKKTYENVYLANIDMSIIHYILSNIQFNNFYSFDDGSGNIVLDSVFYKEKNSLKTILRDTIYFLLGNRFNLKKVKEITKGHYTIYKNEKNVNKNLFFINLFNIDVLESDNENKTCNLILGTSFNDIIKRNHKDKLLFNIQNFINNLKYTTYYIPHPRDRKIYFKNTIIIDDDEVSEFKIRKLLKTYSQINLYGFASTTQFIYKDLKQVDNYYFFSKNLLNSMSHSFNLAENFYFKKVILDDY